MHETFYSSSLDQDARLLISISTFFHVQRVLKPISRNRMTCEIGIWDFKSSDCTAWLHGNPVASGSDKFHMSPFSSKGCVLDSSKEGRMRQTRLKRQLKPSPSKGLVHIQA